MDDLLQLKELSLFEGISADEIGQALDCLGATRRRYDRDEIILAAGAAVSSVGVVLEGSVTVEKEDIMGNRTIIAAVPAPGIFAEAFACAGTEESPVTVRAAENSIILFLRFARIVQTCPSSCSFHSKLIENMMKTLAEKNIVLNNKISVLSMRTLRERIMTYLIQVAGKQGSKEFMIPFSRNELADYLNADRSAVSRELGFMKQAGMIDYYKNSFRLLDMQASGH